MKKLLVTLCIAVILTAGCAAPQKPQPPVDKYQQAIMILLIHNRAQQKYIEELEGLVQWYDKQLQKKNEKPKEM